MCTIAGKWYNERKDFGRKEEVDFIMKTLFIECGMGAAGDMLTAALFDLVEEKETMLARMNAIGLEGVHVHIHPVQQCGIQGLHAQVHVHGHEEGEHEHAHDHDHPHAGHGHEHAHSHHTLSDVHRIIHKLNVSETVKENAVAVYRLIAQAEAKAKF